MEGTQTVRTVVVGYGFVGRRFHAPLIAATAGLSLYGVVARSLTAQEDVRREYPEAKVFTDMKQALADPITELIVLATPTAEHPSMAIEALNAGKHVITDKPMALSLKDCDAMIKAAKDNDRFLSVFQNRRWDGDFLTARKLILEGALGTVRWIELAYQVYAKSSRVWKNVAPEEGGGRYWDLGPHIVDQLLLLFEGRKVTNIYARMHFDNAPVSMTDTHALLVLGFDGTSLVLNDVTIISLQPVFTDGSTGVCDLTSATTIQKPRYLLVGRDATFSKHGTDPQEEALVKTGHVSEEGLPEDENQFGVLKIGTTGEERRIKSERGRWKSYYEDVQRCLRKDGPASALRVTTEQVRRQIAVLEAGLQAARSGKSVEIARPAPPSVRSMRRARKWA